MMGHVWDYDEATQTASYSCPPCDCCETDVFATYTYPAILTGSSLILAWFYTKGADYFWQRAPRYVRKTMWPQTRNNLGNLSRGVGKAFTGCRARINGWFVERQEEQPDASE
tara:strand:- start:2361 stop:2696 length:336 start_codon:yes stop_codon:yes gene_type:complete